ncbi:urotensin-2 [Tiliqua scincoides]|uniref:urotensin-2 n=1 Tax=Tiliqua scincoides TaxID=71010 RepID=UPI003463848C
MRRMAMLGWSCLFLLGLSGPLSVALPVVSSSEVSYWLSAANNNARLNLDALNGRTRGPLRQTLPGLLGVQADDNSKIAGLGPNSFTPRESVKEVLFGNLPRNTLLTRLLAESRKQNKKRGNLSECFWKYCV